MKIDIDTKELDILKKNIVESKNIEFIRQIALGLIDSEIKNKKRISLVLLRTEKEKEEIDRVINLNSETKKRLFGQ